LYRRSDFADLIQEERPPASRLEQPRFVAHRTGKRTAHMSEQLRLQQRFGQRGAVDRDERASGSLALVMDQPNEEFLASAALAVNENRRVQRCDTPRQLEDLLHRGTARDEMF
jgi:hypothetical protein